jgi:hypothetical protein
MRIQVGTGFPFLNHEERVLISNLNIEVILQTAGLSANTMTEGVEAFLVACSEGPEP